MITHTPILVSIAVVTYNHEVYLAQAIESVLMQKINFKMELVIGEDCSTDKTREICISYKNKYPDLIQLVLHEKNIGFRQNNITTWKSCKGKYIALCEGDDFWTDPNKLQKQVDFLEANEGYSTCFHQTLIEYNSNNTEELFAKNMFKNTFNFEEIIERWFTHTSSLVFHNFFKENSNHPFFTSPYFFSDRPLEAFLAKMGKYYFIDETMSTWRQHETNMTKVGNLHQMYWEGAMAYKKMMVIYPESRGPLSEQVIRWNLLAAENSLENGKYILFLKYLKNSLVSIQSFLGLKNNLKSIFFMMLNKKIYA